MTGSAADPIRHVNPPGLGKPPGYSQVVDVRGSRMIFIAGQVAVDAEWNVTGKGDFAAQAEQALRNVDAALKGVGCTAANLVKLNVYVRDMKDIAAFREVRSRYFATVSPPAAPAITLVEVSRLFGPDFLIEIEAIAVA